MENNEVRDDNVVHINNGLNCNNVKASFSVSSCDSNTEIKSMPILDTCYIDRKEIIKKEAGEILMGLDVIDGYKKNEVEPDAIPICEGRDLFEDKHSTLPPVVRNDVVDAVPTREDRKLVEEKQESVNESSNSEVTIRKKSLSVHDNASTVTTLSCNQQFLKNDTSKITFASVLCLLVQLQYMFTKYSILDVGLTIGSIGLYIFDSVTDVLNGLSYLYNYNDQNEDNLLYFYLTMVFIVVPSLIMQIFSLWWEVEDRSRIVKERRKIGRDSGSSCVYFILISLPHILQIAPIFRYIRSAYFGIKSRVKELQGDEVRSNFYHKRWRYESCDVNFLRLFESFLESGTQLVLQIYIMLRTQQTPFITVLSCSVSLFGMAAVFVAYQRSLRDAQPTSKNQISIFGSVVLFLYRTCTILARVLALSLLLNVHIWAWIGLFVLHWVCMSAWVASQNTKFCKSRAGEFVYDAVIGFCYNFAYINVHQGRYNWSKMLVFYFVAGCENLTMALFWFYFRRGGGSLIDALFGKTDFESFDITSATMLTANESIPHGVALVLVSIVPVLFLIGILLMLFYYALLHPEPKVATQEMPDAKFPEICDSVVTMRAHCGDNYRSQRKSPLFRSWHSGCGDNVAEATEIQLWTQKRRPLSEVIIRDDVIMSGIISPLVSKEQFDNKEPPEERFVHKETHLNTTGVLKRLSTATEVVNSPACSCYSLHNNVSYSAMAALKARAPERQNFDEIRKTTDAEVKLREVEIRLEKKQRERRELEEKKSRLVQAGLGPQDLFNRRDRAKYFYTEAIDPHTVSQRKIENSSLRNKLFHPGGNYSVPVPHFSGSGTFPRRSKSQLHQNPYPSNKLTHKLKPICENKPSAYSASLSNISQKRETKEKVPRATSFFVSQNEELVSVESSV